MDKEKFKCWVTVEQLDLLVSLVKVSVLMRNNKEFADKDLDAVITYAADCLGKEIHELNKRAPDA
jgi:hypothetical protein